MHTEKNALDNIAVSECVFISLFSIPHFCGLVFNYRVEWSPGYLCFFQPQPENFCRNRHA